MVVVGSDTIQQENTLGLFTDEQYAELLQNGLEGFGLQDKVPVALLFSSNLKSKWLFCELNPTNPDLGYGLIQMEGVPAYKGEISISEILRFVENKSQIVSNDLGFETSYRLSVFEVMANELGNIPVSQDGLEEEFEKVNKQLGYND